MWLGARLREVLLQRKVFRPKGHETAGRQAEEHLTRIISAGIEGTSWRMWEGLRIPNKTGRRREVDCIVIGGHKVLMIEQKHWSGSMEVVERNGKESVIQHRRSGEEMDHGDVFGTIKLKTTILQNHHGVSEFFAVDFCPFVIFSNRNLEVPDSVLARDDCWTLQDILDYLPNSDGDDPSAGGLSPQDEALAATLDRLGSWDTVHFWGGDQTNGDVYSISENSGAIASLFDQNRERIVKLKAYAERSIWKAIFKRPVINVELFDEDGVFATCEVNPNGEVRYRAAGSRKKRVVSWRHVVGLELTSRIVDDNDGEPLAPREL